MPHKSKCSRGPYQAGQPSLRPIYPVAYEQALRKALCTPYIPAPENKGALPPVHAHGTHLV